MNINQKIAKNLDIDVKQIKQTVALLDDGNTVPFIARYRKEATGNLADKDIRAIAEQLEHVRALEERKSDVLRLITESLKLESEEELPEDLREAILAAETMTRLDDLYRPYRPKRRTRAMMATEKGLKPLADLLLDQKFTLEALNEEIKANYLSDEVVSVSDAISGAQDIIAEQFSDDPQYRSIFRKKFEQDSYLISKVTKEKNDVYEMYYDYQEKYQDVANHRVLAINRAEKEKVLQVKIDFIDEDIEEFLVSVVNKTTDLKTDQDLYELIIEAVKDGYQRLLAPSIERELRSDLTERAELEAIDVFALNLEPLLMQPPLSNARVIAIDPGFRTGCKVAVLDPQGNVLDYTTIYPTEPRKEIVQSQKVLSQLIQRHEINTIAIGNGTASRETEQVVADLIKKENKKDLGYVIVNEAGASIYSASEVGQKEFPDLDVSIRGAVSIGRRLQDPLAELVKIEPNHIGVGQYQHDLNQNQLNESLKVVVEDVVNKVGIDLNTASASLLSYVAGISNRVADNIIAYRQEHGKYKSREELRKVKGLGPKTFEQCAGFLRIRDGINPLDNTGVHPESYSLAQKIIEQKDYRLNNQDLADEYEIGLESLNDIIVEIKNPGRDPREALEKPILRSDVLKMEDLTEGMVLKGTIRNVVDFGAFVDIGVTQDGLVHISELADRFVKHPKDIVKIGDIVDVKIIGLEIEKNRISLSMKQV